MLDKKITSYHGLIPFLSTLNVILNMYTLLIIIINFPIVVVTLLNSVAYLTLAEKRGAFDLEGPVLLDVVGSAAVKLYQKIVNYVL